VEIQAMSVDSSIITENLVLLSLLINTFFSTGAKTFLIILVAFVRLSLIFWHILESGNISFKRGSRWSVDKNEILCSARKPESLISGFFTCSSMGSTLTEVNCDKND